MIILKFKMGFSMSGNLDWYEYTKHYKLVILITKNIY